MLPPEPSPDSVFPSFSDSTRRRFIGSGLALSAGMMGLQRLVGQSNFKVANPKVANPKAANPKAAAGYGRLVSDPEGFLDLPKGFQYSIISESGRRMDDGLFVPGRPDGMGAFPGPDGTTILVRNHELTPNQGPSPWGKKNELLEKVDVSKIFDAGNGETPSTAGTTTLVYDTKKQRLIREFMSMAGTYRNCAGGVTPWGTWITCEESVQRAGRNTIMNYTAEKDHGYAFEVPVTDKPDLPVPVALIQMGRFNREAVAVHEPSGIVYQTEDRHDGLIYRFLPKVKGKLAEGGRLQAMVIQGRPSFDTRNWKEETVKTGKRIKVEWMDLDNIQSPIDDLRLRGFKNGAARFARGEGMWTADDQSIYFTCTNGGKKKLGQLFRYHPSIHEGTDAEAQHPGELELFIEPNDPSVLNYADNLCVNPNNGDLVLCEDPKPMNKIRLLGVTPSGECYVFGRNYLKTEFAGSTFSPDGSTLFVNLQMAGKTLAITGPWQ